MTSESGSDVSGTSKKGGLVLKILIAVGILGGLWGLNRAFDIQGLFRQFLIWIEGLGPMASVIFVVAYIVTTIGMIPGSILTLGAGAVFGVVKGTVLVSIASTLGATCAFLLGRTLARDWIAKKVEGNRILKAIDQALGNEGWRIVFLIRLSPAFPFNLLNYAFGLTKVKLKDYFLPSWAGMLPGTVMYVYIGSLAGDLASIGAGGRERTPQEWGLLVVGLLATIVATLFVTKAAKKALNQKISED